MKGADIMKGCSNWSYSPYTPPMTPKFDIYICRIVPGKNFLKFWWLGSEDETYNIYLKKREDEKFALVASKKGCFFEINCSDAGAISPLPNLLLILSMVS